MNVFIFGSVLLALASTAAADTSETSDISDASDASDAQPSNYNLVLTVHAVLAALAFALFFPLGGILIRLCHFRHTVWIHAVWMALTYVMALAAMGLGIYCATPPYKTHARIGFFVTIALVLQPISGMIHHTLYKRTGGRSSSTTFHVWCGICIITLGICDGLVGILTTGNSLQGQIIYSVLAGVAWLIWMTVSFMKLRRSSTVAKNETHLEADQITDRVTRELVKGGTSLVQAKPVVEESETPLEADRSTVQVTTETFKGGTLLVETKSVVKKSENSLEAGQRTEQVTVDVLEVGADLDETKSVVERSETPLEADQSTKQMTVEMSKEGALQVETEISEEVVNAQERAVQS